MISSLQGFVTGDRQSSAMVSVIGALFSKKKTQLGSTPD
jgi:hypothetical protein